MRAANTFKLGKPNQTEVPDPRSSTVLDWVFGASSPPSRTADLCRSAVCKDNVFENCQVWQQRTKPKENTTFYIVLVRAMMDGYFTKRNVQ